MDRDQPEGESEDSNDREHFHGDPMDGRGRAPCAAALSRGIT